MHAYLRVKVVLVLLHNLPQTLVKNCVVACIIAAAPLAGALAAGAGGGPGLRAVLAPCAFLWLGIMFRELMMDIQVERRGGDARWVANL